jgi:magnesium-transporting ATPase (P-type)
MSFISVECTGPKEGRLSEFCIRGMAVCHTLGDTKAGELVGNQIDMASFQATGAKLASKQGSGIQVEISGEVYDIVKSFDFDNERQAQSVIVQDNKGARFAFVKGSPEAIKVMCLANTVPKSFHASARRAAKLGVYQLAIAFKSCDPSVIAGHNRDAVEGNLFFGGFLNFRNALRDGTPVVLRELAEAKIPTAIITGDNVLAGVAIAREAGMIASSSTVLVGRKVAKKNIEWVNFDTDTVLQLPLHQILDSTGEEVDLAITGEAWSVVSSTAPDFGAAIADRIRVFGRCSPSDKVSVVSNFVDRGRVTLMCGDGQNDCGSLRAAHVGVALSNTEASIVAAFTSLDKNITAVIEILREGRCTAASALSSYSFYILYGQLAASIDFLGARMALYISECCWFALLGVVAISMAFSLPLSKAAPTLGIGRPESSLLCLETVVRITGHLALNFAFLGIAFAALWSQDWFQCRKWGQSQVANFQSIGDSYESSVLFLMTIFEAIATAMSMNFGHSFRQHWIKNYVFVCLSSTWMLCVFAITLFPSRFSCIFRVNCTNEVSVKGASLKGHGRARLTHCWFHPTNRTLFAP